MEFVRHRVFSFAQESTRYCNYSKDKFGNELTYIIPNWLDALKEGNYDSNILVPELPIPCYVWLESLIRDQLTYNTMIESGWSPQQARSILPNSLKTELVMTGFVSDWKGFFKLRDANAAHPQTRELAAPLHEEFKKLQLI